MEFYMKNASDITYESELTPPSKLFVLGGKYKDRHPVF